MGRRVYVDGEFLWKYLYSNENAQIEELVNNYGIGLLETEYYTTEYESLEKYLIDYDHYSIDDFLRPDSEIIELPNGNIQFECKDDESITVILTMDDIPLIYERILNPNVQKINDINKILGYGNLLNIDIYLKKKILPFKIDSTKEKALDKRYEFYYLCRKAVRYMKKKNKETGQKIFRFVGDL